MTIELGFASLKLPNGELVGIVDTPGHRDFIGNMLAGIGGIDAVLLVIAADEGVAAQTREHLAILDLLQIQKGIIVITKTDLVNDPELLDLVELEAHELVQGTSLEHAPLVKVSAKTGSGLNELTSTLEQILANTPVKADYGRPRLPIDRVFSLSGFGTVVTGTLLDGTFSVGDEIISLPAGIKGRIRGIQNFNQKQQQARPGTRTALNLSGIDKSQMARGDVIAWPGSYKPTTLIDVHFRYLTGLSSDLMHGTQVRLFIGASETLAQARLLGLESLKPGQEGFLQLKLAHPVVAVRGDRYILRLPSPSETLGGGSVLDAHPQKLHRRFDKAVLQHLNNLYSGDAINILLQTLSELGIVSIGELLQKENLEEAEALALVQELEQSGQIITLKSDSNPKKAIATTAAYWEQVRQNLLKILETFHQANPLQLGIDREALRRQLKLSQSTFDAVLERLMDQGLVILPGTQVALPNHTIQLTPSQQAQAALLLERFNAFPFTPPDMAESSQMIGMELLKGMLANQDLVQVSEQVLFTPSAYQEMADWVKAYLQEYSTLTLAEFRDHFHTSRKYAAALLEYLDAKGITRRKGDVRVLNQIK